MADLKRNAINQILFTMVDKTDFATIEASLASNFTVKRFGIVNGSATAASISTVASAVSKVGSGIYRLPLTAANCNFDQVMVRIAHASAATQMLLFNIPVFTGTISQLRVRAAYSTVSDLSSKITSAMWAANINAASMASNIASQVWAHAQGTANSSRILLTVSRVSDIGSQVWGEKYTANSAASSFGSLISDIISRMVKVQSAVQPSQLNSVMWYTAAYGGSNVMSQTGKLTSRIGKSIVTASLFTSRVGKAVATASRLLLAESAISDIRSALTSHFTIMSSRVNKVLPSKSLVSDYHSDIRSIVSGIAAATVTADNISDIASAVWAYGLASQVGAGTAGSNLANAQSLVKLNLNMKVSDVYSLISDIYSAVNVTATASDVASAVWAQKWDIHSLASTFGSVIAKWTESGIKIRASDMSSISNYAGAATITTADMSNIVSRVWSAKYTTHSVASSFGSLVSDIFSRVVKVQSTSSNVNSKLGSLAGSRISGLSDILSKVYVAQTSQYAKIASKSALSHVRSMLVVDDAYQSDLLSKLGSRVPKAAATASVLASAYSDITVLKTRVTAAVATSAYLSDALSALHSFLSTTGVNLIPSALSNVGSAVWAQHVAAHSLASSFGSKFSDVESKVFALISRVPAAGATQSKLGVVQTQATAAASRALLNQSAISVVSTILSDFYSKFGSRIPAPPASSDYLSNVYSALHSYLSTTGPKVKGSVVSTLSAYIAAGPAAANVTSIARAVWDRAASSDVGAGSFGKTISDISSQTGKLASRITKAVASQSLLSDVRSDLRSMLSTTGAAVTVSNISDIASAVWGTKFFGAGAHNVVSTFGSAIRVAFSNLSDTQSALDSQYIKMYSAVQAGGLTTSAISDIASAVWGQKFKGAAAHNVGSTFGSAFALATSRLSDTLSTLDSQYVVMSSRVNGVVASKSVLSLTRAALSSDYTKMYSGINKATSQVVLTKSMASDAASAAQQANSRVLLTQSIASDVQSALDSQFAAGQIFSAGNKSQLRSLVDARLDVAYTDATGLNANGLKERVRSMGWVLKNKMSVNDTTGATTLYKDDDATPALTNTLTDDGTSTLRTKLV